MLDFEHPQSYIRMNTMFLSINENEKDEVFAAEAKGDGMVNAGINDGDMLFFCKTDSFRNGEIVAVTVDGKSLVRRIFKGRNRVKLRREIGKGEDTYVKDYILHGRLVGIQRKV